MNLQAQELGRLIGQGLKEASTYKETFVETEETGDLVLANIETVKVTETVVVTKKFYGGCSTLPFVLDHPVYGELDSSSLYIDGAHCSTSTVYEYNVPVVSNVFPLVFPVTF